MKNNYFLNKTIIITGANQGIGLKVAKHFFLKGSNLILCARNKKKLLSVKKKLVTKFQNKLILEQLDISKKRQVDKFYKKIFNKKIIKEKNIKDIKEDFWYLCLDLSWHEKKGTYYDEIYECSPKKVKVANFEKSRSIKLNGFVITKFKYFK